MLVLHVASFGGLSALPLRMAQEAGLFARVGITVRASQTRSSTALGDGLVAGSIAIAHLSPDNVIAWHDEDDRGVRAWLAGSNGPISLLAMGVSDIAGLRGKRVGVDSPQSGFVTILRKLLERHAMAITDVELALIGATRLRYEALMNGSIAATMLTLPWSRLAQRGGAKELGHHRAVAPRLLTSCAASLQGWLDSEPDAATAYAEAISQAVRQIRDIAVRDIAVGLLAEDMTIDRDLAADVLAVMDDPVMGWPTNVHLDAATLETTLSLRGVSPRRDPAAYVAAPRGGQA